MALLLVRHAPAAPARSGNTRVGTFGPFSAMVSARMTGSGSGDLRLSRVTAVPGSSASKVGVLALSLKPVS
eukprot:4563424-Prymnesium_polylepis.1